MDDVIKAIQLMINWTDENITKQAIHEIGEQLRKDERDYINLHYFAYSAGEIRRAHQSIHEALLRFINARMTLERAAKALDGDLEDGLQISQPPVQIVEADDGSFDIRIQQNGEQEHDNVRASVIAAPTDKQSLN